MKVAQYEDINVERRLIIVKDYQMPHVLVLWKQM